MSDPSDRAILAVDAALRDAVAVTADDHLDMTAALAGASAIQGALTVAFERRLVSLLPRKEGLSPEIKPLLAEIARLQADVFSLRAALAAQGTAIPQYRDPLLALRELLNGEAALTGHPPPFRCVVELGPQTLGYGWHAPERHGNGPWFRWSGPGERSGLLVPTGGGGLHRLTLRMRSPTPGLIEGMHITVNGREWHVNREAEGEHWVVRGSFDAAAEGAQRFFALIEWVVEETRALPESGRTDQRKAGFAILDILVERDDDKG